MTFSIGFCFLPSEKDTDYVWAFQCFKELGIHPSVIIMDGDHSIQNASKTVFPLVPTLLCIWHVNQRVLANCKSIVGQEEWNAFELAWRTVIQASTIEQFDQLWLQFKTRYSSPHTIQCIHYLMKEWIYDGQKERLVAAYTNQHLHFGIRVTSRVEGAHAYIKRYLGGKKSKGDLLSTWKQIELAVINQIATVTISTSTLRDRVPIDIDKKLYQGCFGVITWYALRLVQHHFDSAVLPLRPCTGSFTRSMGLPCAHTYSTKKAASQSFTPTDFHIHWYWDHQSIQHPLLDPIWAGRHYTSQRVASTGRILSTGEELAPKRAPTCSRCHIKGHMMSSRQCPARLQASSIGVLSTTEGRNQSHIPALVPATMATTTVSTAAIPVHTAPLTTVSISSSIPVIEAPPISSALSIEISLSSPSVSPTPTPPPTSTLSIIQKPQQPQRKLSPNRPEVVFQAYQAEKSAWLANYPTVRPTEYRKARKWKTLRPKELREQAFYMPRERRDLSGNIISERANWTQEEIIAWLDNEEKVEEDQYKELESEFRANNNRHAQGTRSQMWNRVLDEYTRDSERYIL